MGITFSLGRGVSSLKMAARAVEGVKTGAEGGVVCVMCTTGEEAERYFWRRVEIAERVLVMEAVFRRPSAYLGVC